MEINHIRGFCNFQDIYKFYVEKAEDGSVFVELGSLWGLSTCAMAHFIKESGKNIKFFSVDFWDLRGITDKKWSSEDKQYFKALGLAETEDVCYQSFLTMAFALDLQNFVFPIKLSTKDASKLFKDNSIDFLFIDANHSREGVTADIDNWKNKVKLDGIIAGHDYDWPEIKEVVDKTFSRIVQRGTSWLSKPEYINYEISSDIGRSAVAV